MGKTYLQGDVLTAADLNASLSEAVNTTGSFTFTGAHIHSANLWANGSDGGFRVLSPAGSIALRTDESTSFYTLTTGLDDTGIYYSSDATFAANRSFRWRMRDNSGASRDYLILDRRGNLTAANTVSDRIGNLRQVPINTSSSGYTLIDLDSGKTVSLSGGTVTIPSGTFTAGENITIHNSSTTAALTITQGTGLTMHWAGQSAATTGNRTLGIKGLCTVFYTSASAAIITGAGLT
jgi:hypothetical protein